MEKIILTERKSMGTIFFSNYYLSNAPKYKDKRVQIVLFYTKKYI